MRIALVVEYDGSNYHGWQAQKGDLPTVQLYVEKAISMVANHNVRVICAGRTDSGVHGVGQVVHFDTESDRELKAWTHGCNAQLPDGISVRWAGHVNDKFHARFSALSRRYRYIIYNHPIRQALMGKQLTWNYQSLNVQLMKDAAVHLVGKHDFTSYRAAGCQASSPVRELKSLTVTGLGDLIIIEAHANAFLQHMIRNIAGVLMAIGAGNQDVNWSKVVLDAKNRADGGVTAPPHGLYFIGAEYPAEFKLPDLVEGPHFLPIFSAKSASNRRD